MAALVVPTHRPPPGLYRAARALRRLGLVVLVLVILYLASVGYSAYETAHATVESRTLSDVAVANGEIDLSGSFNLTNPGVYSIEGMQLSVEIANASGLHLGQGSVGPTTVPGGGSAEFPVTILLPISGSAAAQSLLFVDQYIEVGAWANITYAYLFPLSVALTETRSWGAPFEGFRATPGTPMPGGGGIVDPVTLSWANHADFEEAGSISLEVVSATQADCGGSAFEMDVLPGTPYLQTQDVTLAAGCSPAGGDLLITVSLGGSSTTFPPEPIP